jgi:DNA primase
MQQALDALGLRLGLRGGRNSQYRGACPIDGEHPGGRHRSFSVNLNKGLFRCFHPDCGAQGNVLDLWSAVKKLPLREAALDMIQTFRP